MKAQAGHTDRHRQLLDLMLAECMAARSLFQAGLMDQAARHLLGGWHALACLDAARRGDPLPLLSSLDPETLLGCGPKIRSHDRWNESFALIRELAAGPDHAGARRQDPARPGGPGIPRHRLLSLLRYQLRLAEQTCYLRAANGRKVWLQGLLSRPQGKAVAGAALLALLAGAALIVANLGAVDDPQKNASRIGIGMKVAHTTLAEVSTPVAAGTPFHAWNVRHLGDRLVVELGEVRRTRRVEVSLDYDSKFDVSFLGGGRNLGVVKVPIDLKADGLRIVQINVPDRAVRTGYDAIQIDPKLGDAMHAFGHLRLPEEDGLEGEPSANRNGEGGGAPHRREDPAAPVEGPAPKM